MARGREAAPFWPPLNLRSGRYRDHPSPTAADASHIPGTREQRHQGLIRRLQRLGTDFLEQYLSDFEIGSELHPRLG